MSSHQSWCISGTGHSINCEVSQKLVITSFMKYLRNWSFHQLWSISGTGHHISYEVSQELVIPSTVKYPRNWSSHQLCSISGTGHSINSNTTWKIDLQNDLVLCLHMEYILFTILPNCRMFFPLWFSLSLLKLPPFSYILCHCWFVVVTFFFLSLRNYFYWYNMSQQLKCDFNI